MDIIPVDASQGYYSKVEASKVTVDGRSLHVVNVTEVYVTPVAMFAMDPQTAMQMVASDKVEVGNYPSWYSHTLDESEWTVTNSDGEDITP